MCAMVSHLVLGAWLGYTLVGHIAYQQCSHNHIGVCDFYLMQVGKHISTWSIFAVYNCKLLWPAQQSHSPTTLNCAKLEVFIAFMPFVLPHTTLQYHT